MKALLQGKNSKRYNKSIKKDVQIALVEPLGLKARGSLLSLKIIIAFTPKDPAVGESQRNVVRGIKNMRERLIILYYLYIINATKEL
jgi:hypothetical protein